ncbi:MAG TPA: class IV adenylate cyclase [Candidatus Binataceae bacterium]
MRNLEAKFRLSDLDAARAAALGLGYSVRESFTQRDTFFKVARGKLKLREQPPDTWLIHYEREAESGLMLSRYEIVPVADAEGTRVMLARALGVLAEVRKHRELLTRRNVRLHLDRVETLGGFGEIEAILGDGRHESTGVDALRPAVDELLDALGVGAGDLIDVSYFELMTRD